MRLINADEIQYTKDWVVTDKIPKVGGYNAKAIYRVTKEEIDAMPTVDAVPVLCKDCKHRDPEDRKCDCGHDIMWQLPRGDDWYCADGERKDGDHAQDKKS